MHKSHNISGSHTNSISLKQLFRSSMRWNVTGSVIFEVIKMVHHLALFAALPLKAYGEVGIIFSLVYATVAIASLGIEAAVPAFIKNMLHSRQAYGHVTKLLLATHLPFLLVGAGCASLFMQGSLHLAIPCALIVSEGVRSFLRMLLHSSFLHKHAMLTDLVVTISALSGMWTAHLLFGYALTMPLIFGCYLAGSLLCTTLMARNAIRLAHTLPNAPSDNPSLARIMRLRLASYIPTLARTLFSGNVLTPLLAANFGLSTAATFKFASYVSDGIRAIVKSVVRFSGGALLGRLKGQSMRLQRAAFTILSRQLVLILASIVLLLMGAAPYARSTTLIPAALFLLMSFIDHLDGLYTQFYTIQERPGLPMALKLCEIALFIFIIFGIKASGPLVLLAMLVAIKAFIMVLFARSGRKHFGLTLRVRP